MTPEDLLNEVRATLPGEWQDITPPDGCPGVVGQMTGHYAAEVDDGGEYTVMSFQPNGYHHSVASTLSDAYANRSPKP